MGVAILWRLNWTPKPGSALGTANAPHSPPTPLLAIDLIHDPSTARTERITNSPTPVGKFNTISPFLTGGVFRCVNEHKACPPKWPTKTSADKLVNDMRKKLITWGKTPIFVPRWMLSAKYLGFIIMGILFLLWGNVTISLATFEGYTSFWAVGLILSAGISLPWSIHDKYEHLERWSALILGGLILTWSVAAIWRAFAEGDFSRIPGAWAVFLVGMFPSARAFGLLRTIK